MKNKYIVEFMAKGQLREVMICEDIEKIKSGFYIDKDFDFTEISALVRQFIMPNQIIGIEIKKEILKN